MIQRGKYALRIRLAEATTELTATTVDSVKNVQMTMANSSCTVKSGVELPARSKTEKTAYMMPNNIAGFTSDHT